MIYTSLFVGSVRGVEETAPDECSMKMLRSTSSSNMCRQFVGKCREIVGRIGGSHPDTQGAKRLHASNT